MTTTLADINNLINDHRRDTGSNSINMLTTGFRAIQQTIDLFQQEHDWEFTIKKDTIVFHKGITWYSDPTDFKSAIDLRYQRPVDSGYEFDMVSPSNFDSDTLKKRRFTVATQDSSQYIRIDLPGTTQQIEAATEYDGNGTWVGASGITNVATDSYEYYDLSASVKFDFDGTAGTLTNSTIGTVDLSSYKDRAKVYINVYLPSITDFTSIQMKLGSSDSAYYTDTETTNYLGEDLVVGWNKLEFDVWDTEVGSVDDENIDYIQLIFNYSVSPNDTDFRIENIFTSEDISLDLIYYSLYMIYDTSTSAWCQNFNDSAQTTDYPLWSGRWNFVTNSFVDACLEQIFWITGEIDDYSIVYARQIKILDNLKRRLPGRKRYSETMLELES